VSSQELSSEVDIMGSYWKLVWEKSLIRGLNSSVLSYDLVGLSWKI